MSRTCNGGKAKQRLVNSIIDRHMCPNTYQDETQPMQDLARGLTKLSFTELHALDAVLIGKRA